MNTIDEVRKQLRRKADDIVSAQKPFKFSKRNSLAKKNRDSLARRYKETGHYIVKSSSENNYLLYVDGINSI